MNYSEAASFIKNEILLWEHASFLDNMFHCSSFTSIQIDFIFGQNFKDGPQLEPPLDLWNTVSEKEKRGVDGIEGK